MFPDPATALDDPNGLLCRGGELNPETLLAAYQQGIFPWFDSDNEPILWWSPDPRAVIYPTGLHVSRRLARRLRSGRFELHFDTDFEAVVNGCAAPRFSKPAGGPHIPESSGTWITPNMKAAYGRLHQLGWAHCVAVYASGDLVGGLYGVSIGRMFFAESMFSRTTDASKAAMTHLMQRLEALGFAALDCQVMNAHLASMGAVEIPRERFLRELASAMESDSVIGRWPDALS